MSSQFLIVIGTFVLALALRSFRLSALRRMGAATILIASFLAGYFASGGETSVGIAAASLWFFIPMLEIVLRVRNLRLPLDRPIRGRFAPNRETFPHLNEMTSEVVAAGFERVEDGGWAWDEVEQFIRIFYNPESHLQAGICLTEHGQISVAHWGITTRTRDGKVFTTWDYPFSPTMREAPGAFLNQLPDEFPFERCIAEHLAFLEKHGVEPGDCLALDPDEIAPLLQGEMSRQIAHNLQRGVFALAGDGTYRYSWRGCLFLWRQSLIDMLRYA